MNQTIEEIARERDDALRIIANLQTRCDAAEKRVAELEEYTLVQQRVNDRINEDLGKLRPKKLSTSWFTFGQDHFHQHGEMVLNKDTVLKITAQNPRQVMLELFGRKWSGEYDSTPDMTKYPGGILVMNIV
jgi:hypothetical protein